MDVKQSYTAGKKFHQIDGKLLNLIHLEDSSDDDYVWNALFKEAHRCYSLCWNEFTVSWRPACEKRDLPLNTRPPLTGPSNTFAAFGKDVSVEKHLVIYASPKAFSIGFKQKFAISY